MTGDWLEAAAALRRQGEPFALATVVRCERPTSAKPGARALIRLDGTVSGWVGGSCAEPVTIKEALAAMADGQGRLLVLRGDGSPLPGRVEGVREYTMTCHSGGTLEIYVEPVLPLPALVLVGSGPVVETLARLGQAARFAVTLVDPEAGLGSGPALDGVRRVTHLADPDLAPRVAVVVATHGRFDEDALERALRSPAGYVSLVASPRRAAVVMEALKGRRVPPDRLARLKAPAGLDLGAVTPEEIAVSILAEIVARRRQSPAGGHAPLASPLPMVASRVEARDPVCGMSVDVATARHRTETGAGGVYFCCAGCQQAFERDPVRYAASPGGSAPGP
jgi:xanthine dehydrogenase accessory factor